MNATRFESLVNRTTGEERYTFTLPDGSFLVVKFFDDIQREMATCKWFRGSYPAVRSHWKSLTPFTASEAEWESALSVVRGIAKALE